VLEAIKGKPGNFLDTLVVDASYVEVAPRKFERVITLGEFRESSKWDTVIIPTVKRVGRFKALQCWFSMRLGRWLILSGNWLTDVGLDLRGYGRKGLWEEKDSV
jgi:hypothetical protein